MNTGIATAYMLLFFRLTITKTSQIHVQTQVAYLAIKNRIFVLHRRFSYIFLNGKIISGKNKQGPVYPYQMQKACFPDKEVN